MTVWRDDPALKGKFHPEYPDDIQIVVHDGSFRFTDVKPEVMWVHVTKMKEFEYDDGTVYRVYEAVLLNAPHNLKSVKVNDTIMFMAHEGYQYPIYVSQDYLNDRLNYHITPCQKCGLPEVFDPISKLQAHSFPDVKDISEGAVMGMFTSFCPVCGDVLVIRDRKFKDAELPANLQPKPPSIWDRFKTWFSKN